MRHRSRPKAETRSLETGRGTGSGIGRVTSQFRVLQRRTTLRPAKIAGPVMPQPGPANINVSIRVLSPGDNGSVSQTNASANAPDAAPTPSSSAAQTPTGADDPSWLWTWTFTWCGTTMDFATAAGQGTGLDWVWNWLWVWDCDGGAQQPSLPTPDSGSGDTGGDTVQTAPQSAPQSAPATSTGPLTTAQIPMSAVPPNTAGGNAPAVDPLAVDLPALDLAVIATRALEPFAVDSEFVLPVATSVQAAMDAVVRSWPAWPMSATGDRGRRRCHDSVRLVDRRARAHGAPTSDDLDPDVRYAGVDRGRRPALLRLDVARRDSAADRARYAQTERVPHQVARRGAPGRHDAGHERGLGAGAAERAEGTDVAP